MHLNTADEGGAVFTGAAYRFLDENASDQDFRHMGALASSMDKCLAERRVSVLAGKATQRSATGTSVSGFSSCKAESFLLLKSAFTSGESPSPAASDYDWGRYNYTLQK